MKAVVYLLHLDPPLGHARHYTGWTGRELSERLRDHAEGRGSRLLRAQVRAGGSWVVARTWDFPDPAEARAFERRFKRQGGATHRCPACWSQGTMEAQGARTARYSAAKKESLGGGEEAAA